MGEGNMNCPPSSLRSSSGKIDQPEQQAAMWQPIGTAPNDRYILVYEPELNLVSIATQGKDGRWWDDGNLCHPTHWMPLPPPPTPRGNE